MKNLLKTLVFVAFIILFVNRVNAQFDVPAPVLAQNTDSYDAPIINSPSELCRYYDSRPERAIFIGAINNTKDDCLYKISDGYGNVGYIHGYYFGNQYCQRSYGVYFNNAGIPDKTECRVVSQSSETQNLAPTPKSDSTPKSQLPSEKSKIQMEAEEKNKQLIQKLKQTEQEMTQKAQEQNLKDRAAGLIEGEETHYGTVQILREGKITPLDLYIKANAGDIIKTGNDGFIEYKLNDSTAKLGPDGLGVMLGLDQANKKVITPVDWDKDPNYRPELDNWQFWKDTTTDLIDFIGKNRPDYLMSCTEGNVYGCSWGTVEFINGGVGWFNEKREKDFGKNKTMVATPVAAMVPIGTEFSVAVDRGGATTVTTLNGEVVVMDITSRKSVIVGKYQMITIPKTDKGLNTTELQQNLKSIDPNSINKWWDKPIQKNELISDNILIKIIIFLIVLGFILMIIIRRKKNLLNKSAAMPPQKERYDKVIADKYRWFVNNSFVIGIISMIISVLALFVAQPSQLMFLAMNYWLVFLTITVVGLIFGFLGIKSSRKSFVYIGIFLNIIAIILWLKIGMII